MRLNPSYRLYAEGDWKVWALPQHWDAIVWKAVQDRLAAQHPAEHPQTIQLSLPESKDANGVFFLKVFHAAAGTGALKDIFRVSKAARALRQGAALSATGFDVPFAVAAGEQRRYRLLQRSFLLSRSVSGQPLPVYLRHWCAADPTVSSLREKKTAIEKLAAEIRRFHKLGFVHGDLVASNILVSPKFDGGIGFYLMDNDRTAKYPAWMPQRRWRRNLVQLNRLPLAGITLQDRMRFLRRYLLREEWNAKDRRLISWLERKTRRRRWVCDRVQGAASFRELMRWNGPFNRAPVSMMSTKS
jgi:hypothetical protein